MDYISHKAADIPQRRTSEKRSFDYRTPSSRRSPFKSHDYYRGDSNREPRTYMRSKNRSYGKQASPNLQWREKHYLKDSIHHELSKSSRIRRPPLEREVTNDNLLTPPPIPTTEEIMGELRDVTIQYINCNDPTESTARRHRVNQGE